MTRFYSQFKSQSHSRLRGLAFCSLLFLWLLALEAAAGAPAASNGSALPAGPPDAGASVLRVFGALFLVVAMFLAGVWLFKNWQRLTVQRGSGPKLNILEARSLGQRHCLYVIAYQQQRMLLAASPAGITLLSHLPVAEETAPEAVVTKVSFADTLQHLLARKS